MRVVGVVVGPLESNCWIVAHEVGAPAVVIDPGADLPKVMAALDSSDVAAIVLTHAHFDHLGAVSGLIAATGAPLMVHERDAMRLTSPAVAGTGGEVFGFDDTAPEADRKLQDGEVIRIPGLELHVLHTPGHSEGSICLLALDPTGGPAHLFSGDTLFAGSVGRTDFYAGDSRALRTSLAEKLAPLAAETFVHPGHGPDTTIGRESRINPFWPR